MADPVRRSRPNLRPGWGRQQKELSTSVVDIDIALREIVFQRHSAAHDGIDGGRPATVDYAIEGVVLHATPIGGDDAEAGPALVYICSYEQSERLDRGEDRDPRSICYISTDRREDFAWHANIYIESFIFGRLVELYASKRIDLLRMSVLLNVLRDPTGAIDVPTFPALRTVDGRRQHSRCQLLSVFTSLGAHPPRAHRAIVGQSPVWAAALGQRPEDALCN